MDSYYTFIRGILFCFSFLLLFALVPLLGAPMRSLRVKSNQPKKATSAGTNQTLYRGGLRHRSVSSSEAAREEHLSGGFTGGTDCFQFPSVASTLPNVEDEGPSSGGGASSASHRRTPTSDFSHVLKVNIAALFVYFLCIFPNSTKFC